VQALTCPSCGAPISADAQFCTYCGTAVTAASAPLPTSPTSAEGVPPLLPSQPYGTSGGAPPPRRRSRALVVVVIVIVVVLVASVAAYEFLVPAAPAIQVGEIDIWAPDNVCGLDSNPIFYYGYNASTGSGVSIDLGVPNYNSTSCVVAHVATNTSGFTLSAIQVPLMIVGNGTASMNMTVTSPGSSFTGDLNLVFT